MSCDLMRAELRAFYPERTVELSERFREECFAELDGKYTGDMSAYEMKELQYGVIAEKMRPVLFYHDPFYFETGTIYALSDGCRNWRGHKHAGGWTYEKNRSLFISQDPELWERRQAQVKNKLYLICGAYNDDAQHFNFNLRPVFGEGLRGLYEKAGEELKNCEDGEQRRFLHAVRTGLLCVKRVAGKFADEAERLLPGAPDGESLVNMRRIADTARRVPWEPPRTFYEALNTCAFMRRALGSLEGVGPNTFGRVDMDLFPFYEHDLRTGAITPDGAYDLVKRFMITFDMHYDHDMKMVGYGDHELENTLCLGGCDSGGNPVFNELTTMFLRSAREEKTIFPKIKVRYSKNSPREYLDEIDKSVISGTSVVLYHNDDAAIPSLVRAGIPLEEARDYIVTGCWGLTCNGTEKYDHGNYVNLLKPFEYSVHNLKDKMEEVGIDFIPLDGSENFEEVYARTRENFGRLIKERTEIKRRGGLVWNRVSPVPIFSSTLHDCLENRTDITAGGARRNDEVYCMVGLPNIVDSLLAIKKLCFDERKYGLSEFLAAVRSNWENADVMRAEAVRCPGWGDGGAESCALAGRLNDDLFSMLSEIKSARGGKTRLGYLTYTEVRFWGQETLATPDGRKNGDYIAQGLTPSRLKRIPSVTDVIRSLQSLDRSTMAGGSVVNIILPSDKVDLDRCAAFLYAAADSSMQSLQLNCVTREQLLDAREHPEKYPDLIVRVTGFSAKFVSLSPEWQQEVLTRNFYE